MRLKSLIQKASIFFYRFLRIRLFLQRILSDSRLRLSRRSIFRVSSLTSHGRISFIFLFVHLHDFYPTIFVFNIFYKLLVLLIPFNHHSIYLSRLGFFLCKRVKGIFMNLWSFLYFLLLRLLNFWFFEGLFYICIFRTLLYLFFPYYFQRFVPLKKNIILTILLCYKFSYIFRLLFISLIFCIVGTFFVQLLCFQIWCHVLFSMVRILFLNITNRSFINWILS